MVRSLQPRIPLHSPARPEPSRVRAVVVRFIVIGATQTSPAGTIGTPRGLFDRQPPAGRTDFAGCPPPGRSGQGIGPAGAVNRNKVALAPVPGPAAIGAADRFAAIAPSQAFQTSGQRTAILRPAVRSLRCIGFHFSSPLPEGRPAPRRLGKTLVLAAAQVFSSILKHSIDLANLVNDNLEQT